jgi:hypothetical protein
VESICAGPESTWGGWIWSRGFQSQRTNVGYLTGFVEVPGNPWVVNCVDIFYGRYEVYMQHTYTWRSDSVLSHAWYRSKTEQTRAFHACLALCPSIAQRSQRTVNGVRSHFHVRKAMLQCCEWRQRSRAKGLERMPEGSGQVEKHAAGRFAYLRLLKRCQSFKHSSVCKDTCRTSRHVNKYLDSPRVL